MSKNNEKNNVDSSLSLTLIKVNSSKKRSGKVGHSDFYVYCIHFVFTATETRFLVKRYAPRLEASLYFICSLITVERNDNKPALMC